MTKMHFAERLKTLKERSGLSNRQLADRSDVSHSLIAALLSENRGVGELQASRIGAALGLKGKELEAFVLSAIDTCTEKVMKASMDYPAAFLNLIAGQFRVAGILPHDFSNFQINGGTEGQKVKVYLHDGRTAQLSTTLQIA